MARSKRLTKEEIQEDKFIEGLLKAYAFLKENLQTIIIAAVVVLVAVGGYAAYYQSQANRRAEATLALRQATEAYKTAEESLFDAEKLAESEELLKTAQTQLKTVFERYPNTTFADKARYQYANTLYYQGNYPEARTQFQQIIEKHQPENQMDILYAQKAIGNTYEQEGDYEKAIAIYQAFPATPQLPTEIRKFVLMEAKLNQALAYEKLGDSEAARDTYKEIIDEFRSTLETGITEKSRELLEEVKAVITAIGEPLDADVSNPKRLELTLAKVEFNQALAYEKSGDTETAQNTYYQIAGGFGHLLEVELGKKNIEQIEDAKVLMTAIVELPDGGVSNPEELEFVLAKATLNQALAYAKSGDLNAVHEAYHEIADGFMHSLEAELKKKNIKQIEGAKVVIAAFGEPFDIDVLGAEKLEGEKRYFEAYVAYTDAIQTYKVRKDIHGGLSSELRKQIGSFEKVATSVINSIQNARRAENEGRESSALYSYDSVVELETLGLSRRLYENAIFHHKRLEFDQ
ncbi:hypothetical protein C6503_00940 [Candidatus Poribacteria bacterium]|nr:MAG: hypothetical protein C6503_00940 [Candidatus Poribacteria bacterium]